MNSRLIEDFNKLMNKEIGEALEQDKKYAELDKLDKRAFELQKRVGRDFGPYVIIFKEKVLVGLISEFQQKVDETYKKKEELIGKTKNKLFKAKYVNKIDELQNKIDVYLLQIKYIKEYLQFLEDSGYESHDEIKNAKAERKEKVILKVISKKYEEECVQYVIAQIMEGKQVLCGGVSATAIDLLENIIAELEERNVIDKNKQKLNDLFNEIGRE